MASASIFTFLLLFLLLASIAYPDSSQAAAASGGGSWQLLQPNIGITAMHMQLLHNDRVVIYDRTDFGRSNLSLPDGRCRHNPNDTALNIDCTAHSVEYDVAANTFRALFVYSDIWCSSGAVMPNGTLIQAGGYNDGDKVVRVFDPCEDSGCDWVEAGSVLAVKRWYATSHVIPGGRQIIIGGRRQFNYEFYPKAADGGSALKKLPFLVETFEAGHENNLYPFVFLSPDGSLFVFANNRAISLDYLNNKVIRTYPVIPGGNPRSYPSTGSAVLLPLRNLNDGAKCEAEVLVCGGAPKGSFGQVEKRGNFVPALDTCGRIKITDPDPQWAMETMPLRRTMGDMTLLPNGDVLIINGASNGTAGWENAHGPVLNPVLYRPNAPPGSRFQVQNPTQIPRMYHSSSILLRDGRILVGGSNPHIGYEFRGVQYPTELRLESFSPGYLDPGNDYLRPRIYSPPSQHAVTHGQDVVIRFNIRGRINFSAISATLVAPSFTTHSFAMSHRLLELGFGNSVKLVGNLAYEIRARAPGTEYLAPAGYYMLFVVHQGIPSEGIWIQIKSQ
uniref:Aldehyde oxidase GLOX n=1 Tax=Kalanchoe fedtschenkoi TaxID=63787 RepID=A0A7N1A4B8_KALFE